MVVYLFGLKDPWEAAGLLLGEKGESIVETSENKAQNVLLLFSAAFGDI